MGNNISNVTAVSFGGHKASFYSLGGFGIGGIIAIAPSGVSGTVDVTVTTSAGTSAITSADKFSYVSGRG
jgi:hypothetical protein